MLPCLRLEDPHSEQLKYTHKLAKKYGQVLYLCRMVLILTTSRKFHYALICIASFHCRVFCNRFHSCTWQSFRLSFQKEERRCHELGSISKSFSLIGNRLANNSGASNRKTSIPYLPAMPAIIMAKWQIQKRTYSYSGGKK